MSKKKILIVSTALLFVVGIVATLLIINNRESSIVYDTGYRTILPGDTSIQELGGWQRTSPKEADPAYTYKDTLDGVAILVSQQPLPRSVNVEEMAKGFNATEVIQAERTKVFLGTSAKGPQSVIFAKDNLLILIKSQKQINNDSWLRYINSLN